MKTINKKKIRGIVVSHKGQKTAIVRVDRYFQHALYRKYIKRSKRYKAHDEKNEYGAGDRVIIEESRPISKEKHWIIKKKIP
ncbi:MAG: 30S ribosomal protein S17 [Candidatus Niyogibacteria bacterium]|nr:30S ribosomal protein S17 [Candidatus Niyogibacteria bacterium]